MSSERSSTVASPSASESAVQHIALAGNPNVGKTTVFNLLTGMRQKVANYPGVTVERKSGPLKGQSDVEVIDLPGTYSLNPKSMDERVAYDVLVGRMEGEEAPDAVVCVVDATNLERNLFLVTQIMDLGLPVVVALGLAWLSGAAFALNPLGDEGPVLPATLLTGVGGRRFVRGLCLPGAVVGLPLATLGTAAGAVAAGYAPLEAVGLVLLAVVLTAGAVGVAPGVGTRFPRFEAVTVGRTREVVPPALSAVVVYSIAVGLAGGVAALCLLAPAIARALLAGLVAFLPSVLLSLLAGQGLPTAGLATWVGSLAEPIQAIPLGTLRAVGYAGPLALFVLVGLRGYRNAIRRFEAYCVD